MCCKIVIQLIFNVNAQKIESIRINKKETPAAVPGTVSSVTFFYKHSR